MQAAAGEETVPEVVGRLLTQQNLRLGIIDTLTRGQLTHTLIEDGFSYLIAANLYPRNLTEAVKASGLDLRYDESHHHFDFPSFFSMKQPNLPTGLEPSAGNNRPVMPWGIFTTKTTTSAPNMTSR